MLEEFDESQFHFLFNHLKVCRQRNPCRKENFRIESYSSGSSLILFKNMNSKIIKRLQEIDLIEARLNALDALTDSGDVDVANEVANDSFAL